MSLRVRARRLTITVAATTAAVLCAAATGAAAAHADTPIASLSGGWISPVLAPGTPGKTVEFYIQGNAPTATTFSGVTVTYDVSGIAGVATLTPQTGTCTTSGTLITCQVADLDTSTYLGSFLTPEPYEGTEDLPLTLAPDPGSAAGASGSVSVSVAAAGSVRTESSTIPVSLTDGPDISVAGAGTQTDTDVSAQDASTLSHRLSFTNEGDQAAEGVTVEIQSSGYGIDVPETHKNCEYDAPQTAYCYIPDLVAPGATETLSPALKTLTASDLMWQGLSVTVVPGYAALANYTVGTGGAFTLTDSSGAAQVAVTGHSTQSDIDASDNTLGLRAEVSGATANIAASLSDFGWWQGQDEYMVDADATNTGPGYINLGASDQWVFSGDLTIPAGVTLLSVPSSWVPVVDGVPEPAESGVAGYSEYQFKSGLALASGGGAGLSDGANSPIIQAQPGFTGGDATLTVGISQESAADFSSLFGDIDTNTADDTTVLAIPGYGD